MVQNYEPKGDSNLWSYQFTDNSREILSITVEHGTITITAAKDAGNKIDSLLGLAEAKEGKQREKRKDAVDRNGDKFTQNTDERGIIRTILAISSVDKEYSAVLEPETATSIIADTLEKMGKKPSEVGLCEIENKEKENPKHPSTISAHIINYPHSPVLSLNEDFLPKGINTFITCKDADGARKVAEALKSKGLTVPDNTDKYATKVLVLKSDAAQVMKALEGTGIIPPFIAKEIIERTEVIRPQTVAGAGASGLGDKITKLAPNRA
jgi:hypothetical protein